MQNPSITYYTIGLMSGSSLDGLDMAYCEFSINTNNQNWSFKLLSAKTAELGSWTAKLKAAVSLTSFELKELGKEFALYMADEVIDFIKENNISKIDAVVSHGHTISHHPEEGRTCQIGNRQILADALGEVVINNLRQEDMNQGGQGAPIVPIGDKYLFRQHQFCLNIGGIANISVKVNNEMIAYDVCAANQVLNHYAEKQGRAFDNEGALAREGEVNSILLQHLNDLDYYQLEFPKSLDNSYSKNLIHTIDGMEDSAENALATYVEHIAIQIGNSVRSLAKKYSFPLSENVTMLITGGGAFNRFLVERIQANINLKLIVPEADIVNYKEALVMGFIGVLKLRNEVNVLSSVTGAKRDTTCGDVYTPKSTKLV